MTGDLHIVPLRPTHDRTRFECGVPSLDDYLRTQAGQDVRRKANAVFVTVGVNEPDRVIAYYTLCAAAMAYVDMPESARKPLPRYPQVSAILVGRLAVDRAFHGQGLGSTLLADALLRAYESTAVVGSSLVVVDALDDRAASFYAAHGFIPLRDTNRLFLPVKSIKPLVS